MKRKDETDRQDKEPGAEPAADGRGKPGSEKKDAPLEAVVDISPEVEALAAEEAPPAAEEPALTPDQQEVARLTDRLLRLQADFDNYRKRVNREREELQKRAGEAVLADLIPILDNLEFGLRQAEEKGASASFIEGMKMIRGQLVETVTRHGLAAIDALGKPFDPREHEAVAHMPSESTPEGVVMAQTRQGYRLGDRLLRAAMVVVSKGPAGAGKASEG